MTSPTGYGISAYGAMTRAGPRERAYAEALRRAVRPGARVIEIGAGAGYFSLLAARLGATQVDALEPNAAIELARAAAKSNGLDGIVHCRPVLSTDFAPAQRADVIVADLRGVLPLFEHHISVLGDARERLLAPGGVLIPQRDHLRMALVSDEKRYNELADPWLFNAAGLDLSCGWPHVANRWTRATLEAERLVGPVQTLATIDYRTATDPNLRADYDWTADAPATVHGFALWFDAELIDGVGFSSAPGQPELVYGQAFFPLLQEVQLQPGDRVQIALRAQLLRGDYTWTWDTTVTPVASGNAPVRLRQSTFLAQLIDPPTLAASRPSTVPKRNAELALDAEILALVDGRRTIGEIAAAIRERRPQEFARLPDAMARVSDVLSRYLRPR
jgi:protein arginine N-methyltransferase 1